MTGRRGVAWGAVLLATLGVAAAASGQTCTAPIPAGTCADNTSTTLTIGTVMQLTLSTSSTTLTAPASADYNAGFVADNGPTATVKANRSWRLQISSAAATWTAVNTVPGVNAWTNKPAADLTWSTAGGGPFAGLTLVGVNAAAGSASGGTVTNFFFRSVYTWTLDTPGNYSLTVVFTLLAP